MSAVATSPTAASVKLLRSSNEDCPLEWLETEADATPAAKRAQAAMVGKLVWARGTWGTSVLVALADVPTEIFPRKRSSSRSVHGSGCESSPIRPAVVGAVMGSGDGAGGRNGACGGAAVRLGCV